MFRSIRRMTGLAALVAFSVGSSPAVHAQALPPEQLKKIKGSTVFIKLNAGALSATGSGFLIKTEGDFGWVVTNDHVIDPHFGETDAIPMKTTIDVIFHSGTKEEFSCRGVVTAYDADRDLAVVRFKKPKQTLPEPMPLSGAQSIPETTPVFVCGFPYGKQVAEGNKNPEISIGSASVSSLRNNDKGELTSVQLNGALNPGNSGGPVVMTDGKLVGVAVTTIRGAGLGNAIPHQAVAVFLRGRMLSIDLVQTPDLADFKQAKLRAKIADAYGKLKNYKGHVAPVVAANDAAPADVSTLPNAASVELKPHEDDSALVSFQVQIPDAKTVWIQGEWTDADGKVQRTPAVKKTIKDRSEMSGGGRSGNDVLLPTYTAPKMTGNDPGWIGLNYPDGAPAVPLATRLPKMPAGQIDLPKLVGTAATLIDKPVTIDVLTPGCEANGSGDGPSLIVRQAGKIDFIIDTPMLDQFEKIGLGVSDETKRIAVRLTGKVRKAAKREEWHLLIVESIGLLDTKGGVVASIKRGGATESTAKLDPADEDRAKKLLELIAKGEQAVPKNHEVMVIFTDVTEEPGGDKVLQRMEFTSATRQPVKGLKLYLPPELAENLSQMRQFFTGTQNAKVKFKALRYDAAAKVIYGGITDLQFYKGDWKSPGWLGQSAVLSSAVPGGAMAVPETATATPVANESAPAKTKVKEPAVERFNSPKSDSTPDVIEKSNEAEVDTQTKKLIGFGVAAAGLGLVGVAVSQAMRSRRREADGGDERPRKPRKSRR